MASPNRVQVEIVADTRQLRRSLIDAQLVMCPTFWKYVQLRFARWRIAREKP